MRPIALVYLLVFPFAVAAAEPRIDRQTVEFDPFPSAAEIAAAKRWAKPQFARAFADGRPFALSVAHAGGTTMISLEAVSLCNAADGCPLLVFRDLSQRPVLTTMSFHNLMIEYRTAGTYVIPNRSGPKQQCLVSGVPVAKCRPYQSPRKR
jgi:hypothetical protein